MALIAYIINETNGQGLSYLWM